MINPRKRFLKAFALVILITCLAGAVPIVLRQRSLVSIATGNLPFPALQWAASAFQHNLVLHQGLVFRIAASAPHNFRRVGNTFRFEVRKGDRYSSSSWTDDVGIERTEMGETSPHSLSSMDNHFHATYKFMIEPGAKNTAQWLVTGQFFTGGTPPFEIKYMGNDKMAVVIKNGTSSSPVEKTVYLDSADIQRGKWYDMEVDVKFDATGNNGHAYVWRDGVKIADYTGKIGYTNATQGWWEMGAYRKSPAGGETFAINYKDVDLTYGTSGHTDRPSSVPETTAPSRDLGTTVSEYYVI
jgi:hypothetical protein